MEIQEVPNSHNNVNKDLETALLHKQLITARNEIHNLRQQLRALGNTHQQDVEKIMKVLDSFKKNDCNCSASIVTNATTVDSIEPHEGILLHPIGVITTGFPEKKATPRQPGICIGSRGKLVLSNLVFTNPEHALEGLNEFSHMWILFHFHKNDATHVRAKISPPRLNGARTGVFGSRSPHRPCAIGLSLVSIEKIEGDCIYFSGVDMVDGTPVLDIKPYIPQYDNPLHCTSPLSSTWLATSDQRLLEGVEKEIDPSMIALNSNIIQPTASQADIGEREAPDGEEGARSLLAAPVGGCNAQTVPLPASPQVRVPAWINQPPVSKLSVTFSDRAVAQLDTIERDTATVLSLRNSISCVLQEDPRSVYLREKWGNQFFTFLINNLHVSCKFDDSLHSATVFQIKSAGKICECGIPEWQCTIHSDSN